MNTTQPPTACSGEKHVGGFNDNDNNVPTTIVGSGGVVKGRRRTKAFLVIDNNNNNNGVSSSDHHDNKHPNNNLPPLPQSSSIISNASTTSIPSNYNNSNILDTHSSNNPSTTTRRPSRKNALTPKTSSSILNAANNLLKNHHHHLPHNNNPIENVTEFIDFQNDNSLLSPSIRKKSSINFNVCFFNNCSPPAENDTYLTSLNEEEEQEDSEEDCSSSSSVPSPASLNQLEFSSTCADTTDNIISSEEHLNSLENMKEDNSECLVPQDGSNIISLEHHESSSEIELTEEIDEENICTEPIEVGSRIISQVVENHQSLTDNNQQSEKDPTKILIVEEEGTSHDEVNFSSNSGSSSTELSEGKHVEEEIVDENDAISSSSSSTELSEGKHIEEEIVDENDAIINIKEEHLDENFNTADSTIQIIESVTPDRPPLVVLDYRESTTAVAEMVHFEETVMTKSEQDHMIVESQEAILKEENNCTDVNENNEQLEEDNQFGNIYQPSSSLVAQDERDQILTIKVLGEDERGPIKEEHFNEVIAINCTDVNESITSNKSILNLLVEFSHDHSSNNEHLEEDNECGKLYQSNLVGQEKILSSRELSEGGSNCNEEMAVVEEDQEESAERDEHPTTEEEQQEIQVLDDSQKQEDEFISKEDCFSEVNRIVVVEEDQEESAERDEHPTTEEEQQENQVLDDSQLSKEDCFSEEVNILEEVIQEEPPFPIKVENGNGSNQNSIFICELTEAVDVQPPTLVEETIQIDTTVPSFSTPNYSSEEASFGRRPEPIPDDENHSKSTTPEETPLSHPYSEESLVHEMEPIEIPEETLLNYQKQPEHNDNNQTNNNNSSTTKEEMFSQHFEPASLFHNNGADEIKEHKNSQALLLLPQKIETNTVQQLTKQKQQEEIDQLHLEEDNHPVISKTIIVVGENTLTATTTDTTTILTIQQQQQQSDAMMSSQSDPNKVSTSFLEEQAPDVLDRGADEDPESESKASVLEEYLKSKLNEEGFDDLEKKVFASFEGDFSSYEQAIREEIQLLSESIEKRSKDIQEESSSDPAVLAQISTPKQQQQGTSTTNLLHSPPATAGTKQANCGGLGDDHHSKRLSPIKLYSHQKIDTLNIQHSIEEYDNQRALFEKQRAFQALNVFDIRIRKEILAEVVKIEDKFDQEYEQRKKIIKELLEDQKREISDLWSKRMLEYDLLSGSVLTDVTERHRYELAQKEEHFRVSFGRKKPTFSKNTIAEKSLYFLIASSKQYDRGVGMEEKITNLERRDIMNFYHQQEQHVSKKLEFLASKQLQELSVTQQRIDLGRREMEMNMIESIKKVDSRSNILFKDLERKKAIISTQIRTFKEKLKGPNSPIKKQIFLHHSDDYDDPIQESTVNINGCLEFFVIIPDKISHFFQNVDKMENEVEKETCNVIRRLADSMEGAQNSHQNSPSHSNNNNNNSNSNSNTKSPSVVDKKFGTSSPSPKASSPILLFKEVMPSPPSNSSDTAATPKKSLVSSSSSSSSPLVDSPKKKTPTKANPFSLEDGLRNRRKPTPKHNFSSLIQYSGSKTTIK